MKNSGGSSAALGLVLIGLAAFGAHGLACYEWVSFDAATAPAYLTEAPPAPEEINGWQGLLFSHKLDANTATEEDWRALPFVGKRTASAIVQTRERLGGFEDFDQFMQVSGIGPKRFARLKDWVEIRAASIPRTP